MHRKTSSIWCHRNKLDGPTSVKIFSPFAIKYRHKTLTEQGLCLRNTYNFEKANSWLTTGNCHETIIAHATKELLIRKNVCPSEMEHYLDTLWLRRMLISNPCGSNETLIHCFAKCAMVQTLQWRSTQQALQHYVSRKDSKTWSQRPESGHLRIRPLWLSAWLHLVVETVHTWRTVWN